MKELLMLTEVGDFRAPDSKWYDDNGKAKRKLSIGDEIIIASIEQGIFQSYKNIRFLNLAFAWLNEKGDEIETPTNKNEDMYKVISASFNAFMEKINEFDYEILTFICEDRIETRMRIYNRIIKKNLRKFGDSKLDEVKLNNGSKAIIIFKDISNKTKEEYVEWLKSQKKL
jgi:hypothetical protein